MTAIAPPEKPLLGGHGALHECRQSFAVSKLGHLLRKRLVPDDVVQHIVSGDRGSYSAEGNAAVARTAETLSDRRLKQPLTIDTFVQVAGGIDNARVGRDWHALTG